MLKIIFHLLLGSWVVGMVAGSSLESLPEEILSSGVKGSVYVGNKLSAA